MTPPTLTPLPLDDQARSGIPVVVWTDDLLHSGFPMTYGPLTWNTEAKSFQWQSGALFSETPRVTGYLPLGVPIMGPPPKDDKWRLCWFKGNGPKEPVAMRWYKARTEYGDEAIDIFFDESEVIAHLPHVPAPELPTEPKPEPPAELTLTKATIKELIDELATRVQPREVL